MFTGWPLRQAGSPACWGASRQQAGEKETYLNRRLLLCVIVGSGGRVVGMAMFWSEDATFR